MTPVPDSAPGPGKPRLRVIVICFLVAVLDGFDAQALAYVAPLLIDEWGVAAGSFAPAFAAGLAGLAVGAMLFGTAADRVGRRPAIVGALALCGIGSLATAFAPSFAALLPLRFVTGLGIGGSLPNVIALTAEWMPHRYRAVAIGTMICGFPLGGFLGGVLAAQLTPAHGWQAVFVLGGVAPLLLAVTASLWLPESVRFLAWRHAARPRAAGAVTADLFRDGRVAATCLLWLAFFMNLLAIFLMVSWLPVLLRDAGVLLEGAMLTAALYSLGGIPGSILVTALMGRFGAGRVLGTTLLAGALATVLLGSVMGGGVVLQATILIAGACTNGSQAGLNALAATIYPTPLRATGTGWALGVGRIGAILGPLAGGGLIAAGFAPQRVLALAAAPVLVAAVALVLLARRHREES